MFNHKNMTCALHIKLVRALMFNVTTKTWRCVLLLRPYQARQGRRRPRPDWVLAPIHGDEERGPAKAVRSKFSFVEPVIQFVSSYPISFQGMTPRSLSGSWMPRPMPTRRVSWYSQFEKGVLDAKLKSNYEILNFPKNIEHSLCAIFVHFQGVRRHCFSWCWGRWSFCQDGRCCR